MKKFALLTLTAAVFAATAGATSATADFTTTAQVDNSCIISTTGIDFGSYQAAATDAVTASGNVTTTCTKDMVFALNYSGFTGQLSKVGSGDKLNYTMQVTNEEGTDVKNLDLDTGMALPYSVRALARPLVWPVHATIAAGQWGASAGAYKETMTFSVDY